MDAPFVKLVARARRAEWRRRYGLVAIFAATVSATVGVLVLAWVGGVNFESLLYMLYVMLGVLLLPAVMVAQLNAGFMRTPREPWSLQVLREVDTVVVEIAGASAAVALAEIVHATYYFDDYVNEGIEDVLALELSDDSVLRVPGCAEGFGALVAALGARVERVYPE